MLPVEKFPTVYLPPKHQSKKLLACNKKKSTVFNDNITTQGVLGAYLDIHALLSQFDCFVHQIVGFDVSGGYRVSYQPKRVIRQQERHDVDKIIW